MRRKTLLVSVVIAAVLALFCGHQLYFRAEAERNDRACATAIEMSQLELLTDEPSVWLDSAGIDYVIREGYGYDHRNHVAFALTVTEDVTVPVALIENHTRTGVTTDPLPDQTISTVKALYLYDDYANRMVGNDSAEIEDLLFRAAVERGMRLLILTPFTDETGVIYTEPEVYAQCIANLKERIESRGLVLDGTFSCMELDSRAELPVSGLTQKVLMLLSAIVFPCGTAILVAKTISASTDARSVRRFLVLLFMLTAAGAAMVSAFMTDYRYLLGIDMFSGVKLALLTPMALAGLLLVWTLRHELLNHSGWKRWLILVLILLAVCGVYLLLTARSGDYPGWTSDWETALRTWLEHEFYVRPRTKELFFAAPCIPVFLWACRSNVTELKLLCGMGVCLESVSVVNTFCHGVAPLSVSMVRSFLGLGIGVALGVILSLFLWTFERLAKKRKASVQGN